MIKQDKKYWFFLEPYIYSRSEKNCGLLYNTFDSSYIEIHNAEVNDLLRSLLQKSSNGVIYIDKEHLSNPEILNFIKLVRKKFFGDLICCTEKSFKPFQFTPQLNLQRDLNKTLNIDEKVNNISIKYLTELIINLNRLNSESIDQIYKHPLSGNEFQNLENLSLDLIKIILAQIDNSNINHLQIKAKDFSQFPRIDELFEFLNRFSVKKTISVNYLQGIDSMSSIMNSNNVTIQFVVYPPIEKTQIQNILNHIIKHSINSIFLFYIGNESEAALVEKVITDFKISDFEIKPDFNVTNINFFEKFVYLSKNDIYASPLSMREIFAHQKVNTNFFGKLEISTNGDVYPNIFFKKIGNISTHSLEDLILCEIKHRNAWLNIRDSVPCINCLYQWLCPSPSNYEEVIGKPNLCKIKS